MRLKTKQFMATLPRVRNMLNTSWLMLAGLRVSKSDMASTALRLQVRSVLQIRRLQDGGGGDNLMSIKQYYVEEQVFLTKMGSFHKDIGKPTVQ